MAETHFVRRGSSIRNYFQFKSAFDLTVIRMHCACEGSKQRFVPTGAASGDNEIKQRRNFSETHFPGVAPCGFRLDGHDGDAVRDGSRPGVCYPVRGKTRVGKSYFRLRSGGSVAELRHIVL